MDDIEPNIQNISDEDLRDKLFPRKGTIDVQLDKIYNLWKNHGVTIATIINNYRDGKTTKVQMIKLLHPYTAALITVHEVATTIRSGGQ